MDYLLSRESYAMYLEQSIHEARSVLSTVVWICTVDYLSLSEARPGPKKMLTVQNLACITKL